jgi:hypothetical protein
MTREVQSPAFRMWISETASRKPGTLNRVNIQLCWHLVSNRVHWPLFLECVGRSGAHVRQTLVCRFKLSTSNAGDKLKETLIKYFRRVASV